jgi:hypothetical protein
MTTYRLIKGKLCDFMGNPVPLEFGNMDQINFINRCQDIANKFKKSEGVSLEVYHDVKYTAEVLLNCLCGNKKWIDEEVYDEEDIDVFNAYDTICSVCNSKYHLTTNDDGEVIATLVKEEGAL